MLLLDKIKKDSNLIKHSGAIHITNSLSLLDRKVMNVLLKNAYEDLGKKKFFEINLKELRKVIGWHGNNDQKIKECFVKLNTTSLQWNVLGKDRKNEDEWTTVSLLASANIRKKAGYCIYEYSDVLVNLFKNPNIYAKIDLNVQKYFKSKHAIAIWEFLVECLSVSKKDSAVTDWIELDDFKKLLALDESRYSEFKNLNRDIIKPSLAEINDKSNIEAVVRFHREGRKVDSLSFKVDRKNFSEEDYDIQPSDRSMKDITKSVERKRVLRNANINYEEFINIIISEPFSFQKHEVEDISEFCGNISITMEELMDALEAVKENITNHGDKINSLIAQVKSAIKGKWKPKLSLEKKQEKRQEERELDLIRKLELLQVRQKRMLEEFDNYLLARAKKGFSELDLNERKKRKEKFEKKIANKLAGNGFDSSFQKIEGLIAEEKAVKEFMEEFIEKDREYIFQEFQDEKNVSALVLEEEMLKVTSELSEIKKVIR